MLTTERIRIPPLRAVREARGLGLRELARRTGMDAGHLSRVERGQSSLSISNLKQLADALGLSELSTLITPYDISEGR